MHCDITAEQQSPDGGHPPERALHQRIGIAGDSGGHLAQTGKYHLAQADSGQDGNKQDGQRQQKLPFRENFHQSALSFEHTVLLG